MTLRGLWEESHDSSSVEKGRSRSKFVAGLSWARPPPCPAVMQIFSSKDFAHPTPAKGLEQALEWPQPRCPQEGVPVRCRCGLRKPAVRSLALPWETHLTTQTARHRHPEALAAPGEAQPHLHTSCGHGGCRGCLLLLTSWCGHQVSSPHGPALGQAAKHTTDRDQPGWAQCRGHAQPRAPWLYNTALLSMPTRQ